MQRLDWTDAMIAEAIADADVLRQSIHLQLDTGCLSPNEVAVKLLDWLEQSRKNS